jgi:hypothetical protein
VVYSPRRGDQESVWPTKVTFPEFERKKYNGAAGRDIPPKRKNGVG